MNKPKLPYLSVASVLLISACGVSDEESDNDSTINTPPSISLNGNAFTSIQTGMDFNDPGATASDSEDGNLTSSISVVSNLDTNAAGNYAITYSVSDSAGASSSIIRNVTVNPNNIPVITLIGTVNDTVGLGENYIDPGATAIDTEDGNLTSSLRVVSSLDTSIAGHYTITYSVTDSAGDDVSISRSVIVSAKPNLAPVISLLGNANDSMAFGAIYFDPGATATDSEDGNLTTAITAVSNIDSNIAGDYFINYSVADSDGANASVIRTVTVNPNSTPVISLLGKASDSVAFGGFYNDPGATAADTEDGNLTSVITAVSNLNTSIAGNYSITYSVSDSAGASISVSRSVAVSADPNSDPVISLSGSANASVAFGTTYSDPGAIATDSEDGDLTSAITVISDLDTSAAGNYTITYSVTDSSGASVSIIRNVTVKPNSVPVISLLGNANDSTAFGSTYADPGATATDIEDGDLTSAITIVSNIDTSVSGNYSITYSVIDSAGAIASVNRMVTVTPDPNNILVISLLGSVNDSVPFGATYSDPGATATDSEDGDLTSEITVISNLDTSVTGNYTITYSVIDSAGAIASVSRTVTVNPNSTPVISLLGNANTSVAFGATYLDPGATATDSEDGDLTSAITTVSNIDSSVAGNYFITYSVADSAGANASVSRTVTVNPNSTPVISLLGNASDSVAFGGSYNDPGATATDSEDGDLTTAISTVSNLDTSAAGNYTITYSVIDSAGTFTSIIRNVTVNSNNIPVISLLGTVNDSVGFGENYIDPGATATDSEDGDLTSVITAVSNIDTSVPGNYTITYSVTDSAGASISVSRSVAVSANPNSDPVISLLGSANTSVAFGATYIDPGATATDSEDGDLTSVITTDSNVDTSAAGNYTITYSVTDSSGSSVSIIRNVTVNPNSTPMISLLGNASDSVAFGGSYNDPGATATDSEDGDLTTAITTVSNVDTSIAGNYTITYSVTDSAGAKESIIRNVTVNPNSVPDISLIGSANTSVAFGATYADPGATATDSEDGNLTSAITTVSNVDTSAAGNYTITYSVIDSAGAIASIIRNVTVNPNSVPAISLLGDSNDSTAFGSTYNDPGATATDDEDGDLTSAITIVSNVDTSAAGNYTITYSVTDSAGANASVNRMVTVTPDPNNIPEISLLGSVNDSVSFGATYTDPGATATDSEDGDLTSAITVISNLDTSVAGNYTITYSVIDSAGAIALVSRTVTVNPNSTPVISLLGNANTSVAFGATYIDPGATATDSEDGDLTSAITTVSNIDSSVAGNYFITYSVADSAGANASVSRTVTVNPNSTPVISLLGNANDSVAFGDSYIDPGATATDIEDGDLTPAITIVSNIETSVAGNYTITYNVTDSARANASIIRNVTVNPNNIPVISLLGNIIDSIGFGETYADPGATATDTEDGDLTFAITVETTLDTRFPGDYSLTYRVNDSAGSSSTPVIRNVTVSEPLVQSREDAFRFLQRATFGPTTTDINSLTSLGYEAWIDQQMASDPILQLPALLLRMTAAGHQTIDTQPASNAIQVQRLREDAWFDIVLNGNDQLRQRVAFALSEIFVVSFRDNSIRNRPQGLANYNDILVRNAFGNFRNLLQEVTLNPLMGHYLSMRRNEKANAAENILPDENYAREVMQLFSIGLVLLNPDGTPQLDINNQQIPAYTQQDILNFARVFTGWNYGDAPRLRSNARTLQSELIPMTAFEDYHDTGSKTLLLEEHLAAGQTAAADLNSALDNIFNHPNVGPFISKQLILKLITSNPTAEYVERVAGVFDDNGLGVRGDLSATVRAILMDPDALLGHKEDPFIFGKLKEPLLKFTALWRAFDAVGAVPGRIRFTNTDLTLGQEHLRAPSVFNFFQPEFSKPGEIRNLQLLSPEFQILGESKAIGMHNELRVQTLSNTSRSSEITAAKNPIILDIEFEKTLADNPQTLVDYLSEKLIGTPINTTTRTAIIDWTTLRPLNDDGEIRVEEALYLLTISPEFAVQR